MADRNLVGNCKKGVKLARDIWYVMQHQKDLQAVRQTTNASRKAVVYRSPSLVYYRGSSMMLFNDDLAIQIEFKQVSNGRAARLAIILPLD